MNYFFLTPLAMGYNSKALPMIAFGREYPENAGHAAPSLDNVSVEWFNNQLQ